MGVCQAGKLTVTDMDTIEKSNLNRQFLFRDKNIGQAKSTTACAAAVAMNPHLNVQAFSVPVGAETENVFDAKFWKGIDLALNALDTWAARLYVDSKCVEFKRPLLESGTLGATGHTQIIVPHLTLNFGATKIQKEVAVPSCTIHHFPHTIHHTLTWAREQFDSLFVATAEDLSRHHVDAFYLSNLLARMPPAGQVETLRRLLYAELFANGVSRSKCVREALGLFDTWYNSEIRSLLQSQPPDSLDEHGAPFWSAPKRAPSPIAFDFSNKLHLGFVTAVARLVCFRHGLSIDFGEKDVLTDLAKAEEIKLEVLEKVHADDTTEANRLASLLGVGVRHNDNNAVVPVFVPASFEKVCVEKRTHYNYSKNISFFKKKKKKKKKKDDDSNSHIDFIHCAANLRALNYGITPIDRLETKKIAGKIIPAMVTTTAAITGLVLQQLYLFATNVGFTIETFKEAQLDLATNLLAFAEPQPCPKTVSTKHFRAIPEGFTLWDSLDISIGNVTIQKLGSWLTSTYNCSLKSVTCEGLSLFRASDKETREQRAKMKVVDIYCQLKGVSQLPDSKYRLVLSLLCLDKATDLEVEFPTVNFLLGGEEPKQKKLKKKEKK